MSKQSVERLILRAEASARQRAAGFRWDPFGGAAHDAPAPPPSPARGSRAPLLVLLADDESTLFWDLHDPRLEVIRLADTQSAAADVVVMTRVDRFDLERSARNIPAELWARLAAGKARLALDASGEGTPHNEERSKALHDFLRAHAVPLENAVFLTQDRGYPDHYAGHCAQIGLGPAGRVQVWLYDRYIQRTFAAIHDRGEEIFRERLALYAARGRSRPRRFVSLNYTVRPTKALFLLQLLKDGLWDRGFISVGPLHAAGEKHGQTYAQYLRKRLKRLNRLDMFVGLEPWLDRLEAVAPIALGGDTPDSLRENRRALLEAGAFPEYQDSWFTVVTESNTGERLNRITEKPFKPILNFHPMIFLANPGALRLLRAYGFDTYGGFFDEGYDDEPPIRTRFAKVYEQVAALCRADEAELARRDDAAAEAVVFNAWWGLTQLPRLFRSHIDAALVDRLIDFAAA